MRWLEVTFWGMLTLPYECSIICGQPLHDSNWRHPAKAAGQRSSLLTCVTLSCVLQLLSVPALGYGGGVLHVNTTSPEAGVHCGSWCCGVIRAACLKADTCTAAMVVVAVVAAVTIQQCLPLPPSPKIHTPTQRLSLTCHLCSLLSLQQSTLTS